MIGVGLSVEDIVCNIPFSWVAEFFKKNKNRLTDGFVISGWHMGPSF